MEFVETPTFSRMLAALLTDDEYRALQNELMADPECGALIRNGGGIRKMRFAAQGRGKSGGVRVIYHWAVVQRRIYMLVIYPTSVKDTLTDRETALMRAYVKELTKEL